MTVSTVTASPQALAAAATVKAAASPEAADQCGECGSQPPAGTLNGVPLCEWCGPVVAHRQVSQDPDEREGALEQPVEPAPDATAVIDLRDAHTEAIPVTKDGGTR
jgi:hypothetical protein